MNSSSSITATHWKVRSYLSEWCDLSKAIDVATGYFEIGALLCLKDKWQNVDCIRVLMGDEVSRRTKRAFTEGLKKITDRLDQSLESEKPKTTFLKEFPQWLKVYTLAKFSAVFIAGIHSILRPICFSTGSKDYGLYSLATKPSFSSSVTIESSTMSSTFSVAPGLRAIASLI